MPLYDIEYVCSLSFEEQEQLANALTSLHATRFKTPRCFVNVRFTDVSKQIVFRGGKLRKYNRVIIRTRAGENRTNEIYVDHCKTVVSEWERNIGKEGERGLRTVWVLGALTTALEAGIARPKVGVSLCRLKIFERRLD
jgi:phenylpyruvate tautomerase PptA (4-oxalocrotonate tautomerase family)